MNEEKDFVTFYDDNGNGITLKVIDYFLYDGQEYVILADMGEDETKEAVDVFIMQVNVIDKENEEFVHINPEKEQEVLDFSEKLLNGELPNENEIF